MRVPKRINENMLINSYLNLKSILKTAVMYEINRNRVNDILKKHSVELFDNKGGAPKKIGEYEKRKILKKIKTKEYKLASEAVDFLRDQKILKFPINLLEGY